MKSELIIKQIWKTLKIKMIECVFFFAFSMKTNIQLEQKLPRFNFGLSKTESVV